MGLAAQALRRGGAVLVALLVIGLVLWRWSGVDPVSAKLEGALLDLRFRIRGPLPPPESVVIVAIDEPALDRIGAYEPLRAALAEALGAVAAAGPRVVALDILLADRTGADAALAEAIDGSLINSLNARSGAGSVVFYRDGDCLAVAHEDGTLRLWDLAAMRLISEIRAHEGPVRSVAVHRNGQLFATGGGDGRVKLWALPDGKPVTSADRAESPVNEVKFAPDGGSLAAAREDGVILLLDGTTLRTIRQFLGHHGNVSGLAFHPGGARVATGGADRTIRLWDLHSGQEVLSVRAHLRSVHRLAFSPDGSILASASADRTLRLLEATPP
jgi:WD40 repeat protein